MSVTHNLILPYSVKKRQIGENIFIQVRVFTEGGFKIWTDELESALDVLRDCGLTIYKTAVFENPSYVPGATGTTATPELHLYEVSDDDSIEEYLEIAENSYDLCWRTFYLVLQKSKQSAANMANMDNIFFHYLPVPESQYFDSLQLKHLFEYILKLSYNIIIE